MTGESTGETLEPTRDAQNFGSWWTGLIAQIAHSPPSYTVIDEYLKSGVLDDFWDVKNPVIAAESRSLLVQFRRDQSSVQLPFAMLSDGEKCFFLGALVMAANKAYGPIFCFWDEPDSHLSMDEVSHFVTALRRAFEYGGQVLMTSHNAEALRRFSDENTLMLFRRGHLEPTRLKFLEEIGVSGDRVEAFLRGDILI
jgi:ATPase subunit of ABC transporter with duplicated ATPase domains